MKNIEITDNMLNFRDALISLIPFAEHAGVPWKRLHAYDEWDNIATALFENLVTKNILWLFPENVHQEIQFPPYDLLIDSYVNMSTIEVIHPVFPQGRWVFHAFATLNTPFDSVEVREVSQYGKPLSDNLRTCPFKKSRFIFRA